MVKMKEFLSPYCTNDKNKMHFIYDIWQADVFQNLFFCIVIIYFILSLTLYI
jgi:hypothetical protein